MSPVLVTGAIKCEQVSAKISYETGAALLRKLTVYMTRRYSVNDGASLQRLHFQNVYRGEYTTLKMGPRGIALSVSTQPDLRSIQEILKTVGELIECISIIERGGLFYADQESQEPEPNTDGK